MTRMERAGADFQNLQAAIAAFEAQRSTLGDEVVDAALGPLRERLAALQVASASVQQRKLATVLFADVSGFTALSESMDAEVVTGIINDLWSDVDAVIQGYGGRIDKHIGDAVMAVWGAREAREDDPENAVHAALAMQTAVAESCKRNGIPLSVRIGINTGRLVLGTVGTIGEVTVMGDAVNLASRLEKAAPLNGVLISHDTYLHVRGIFDLQAQAPLRIRGKSDVVQTYIVLGAKPRAFRIPTRGVEGVETRMVGRDRELGLLEAAFEDVLEASHPSLVTIVGEAGVGKSRLLYEFDKWLDLRPESILYFRGRSVPTQQGVPNSLFRDLFAFRFQILSSDSAAVAMDKFRQGMADALEPDRADVLGHWLGFNFESSEAVRTLLGSSDFGRVARAHLLRYFRMQLDAGPVAILLEDIHWADDHSLDLMLALPEALEGRPLLLVALARPDLFERYPGWGEDRPHRRQVALKPLSRRASKALVKEILQWADNVPLSLQDLIIDTAEGNPFYVEEMVKMLIDQGVIVREEAGGPENPAARETADDRAQAIDPSSLDGMAPPPAGHASRAHPPALSAEHWLIRAEKLEGLKVPTTLHGLLQARLDVLSQQERLVLQRAAVVGRRFWLAAVAALTGQRVEDVRAILRSMAQRELIYRRGPSAFAGTEEYVFKHALLRDVVYESVLLKHRAELHAAVARWLEANAGERRDESLGAIIEHYVQAGEHLQAAERLERSGHEALQVGSLLAARQLFERALALREASHAPQDSGSNHALVALGRTLWLLADFPASAQVLERAVASARATGDRAAEADGLGWMAILLADQAQFEQATEAAEAALVAARQVGGRSLPWVLRAAAGVAWFKADLEMAEALATEAIEVGRQVGESEAAALALSSLGNIATSRRDLPRATAIFTAVLEEAQASGNVSREATALANLGNNAYLAGDFETARSYAQAALERQRELGERINVVVALGNLAQAYLRLGETDAARRYILEALGLARSIGAQNYVAWVLFLCGQVLLSEGQPSAALALFGLARAQQPDDYDLQQEIDDELAGMNLPPEQIGTGLAAGEALDIDTVAQEVLDGKW